MIEEQNPLENQQEADTTTAEKSPSPDQNLTANQEDGVATDIGEQSAPEIEQKVLEQEIVNLKGQLEEQNRQSEELKNRYLSLAAEFDNFRKRTAKEKMDLQEQIKAKTLEELLPAVDNFERARAQIKPANDGEMAIHKSYQGVYKILVDSLKRLGVSPMRAEGEPFDPQYHEAMLQEPTNEYPEGTVIEQLVRGYLIGDRILRHAMVKVAAPGSETANVSEGETSEAAAENDSQTTTN